MTNILIIGAHGEIARVATRLLLERTDASLTLYLRRARRLAALASNPRIRLIEADATDQAALEAAMAGQDIVYANLAGDMDRQAQAIVAAMKAAGVRRLIFISSMGIYDEVPGQRYRSILDPYRDSAAIVEGSGLDYTVIRPAWLNDDDEIAYGTTAKGEPFANPSDTVSRKSVSDLIVRLVTKLGYGVGGSLGVHGTH
ncbi:NAD(P)H-binding protein [Acetobacter sp. DsW_063]|uniref:NAD(P)H-binding protein n=1 Tax=Acetobacter sp. DsW_063 TaxID=1514894 RepID=UPI000A3C144A|nr:NAD(P)H-binding protein [Acetobacter sp. DsW_063]OUJ11613.1 NAD-dependent dehydratase [Acetobacter sp. DsW_063]